MASRYYTIGMAGHIDHGKTTLTKALTGIDTDRLKEEKERNISIELGFAKFPLGDYDVSIVDVPGHEKFIRQMIAGVAGIDLVVVVIAADEGVMPQTREHLEILSFLGITHGVIAITKMDHVEADFLDLVEDDIRMAVEGTIFEQCPLVRVDSVTGTGLETLKVVIQKALNEVPERKATGVFRLPIDQVFTIQGHGTIVRGVVYGGMVESGERLFILPKGLTAKARELQVHSEQRERAYAGQRAAINLSGIAKEDIKRGDVLVSSSSDFKPTITLDVALNLVQDLEYPLKQRAPVKFHSGTAEVMGKILFFDRKEAGLGDEVFCQIRLDEPVIVLRGDRFVIRRPSPVETLGGGWVIDPMGRRYRYGEGTVQKLKQKAEGTPEERLIEMLDAQSLMTQHDLLNLSGLTEADFGSLLNRLKDRNQVVEVGEGLYTSIDTMRQANDQIQEALHRYHDQFPMRYGMNKAECLQMLEGRFPKKLVEWLVDYEIEHGLVKSHQHYLAWGEFEPNFPKQWKMRMERALEHLKKDGLSPTVWEDYLITEQVPKELHAEWKHYVLQNGFALELDETHMIHSEVFEELVQNLYKGTEGKAFGIKEAKASLDVSRKNLVLFLERLDELKVTERDGDQRKWLKEV